MTPSLLHVPPRLSLTTASLKTGPPLASIFLSARSAKNPMYRPSGDQKGRSAASVPAGGRAVESDRLRPQRRLRPAPLQDENTTRVPSGEISTGPALMRVEISSPPGGGRIEERMTGIGGGACRASRAPRPATARARTPAITQDTRSFRRRAAITGAATPVWDPDSAIQRSSLPRSRALCQRSSGSLARHFRTTRSRAGGDIGWTLEIGAGSLDMIAVMSAAWLAAENAFFPVAIS